MQDFLCFFVIQVVNREDRKSSFAVTKYKQFQCFKGLFIIFMLFYSITETQQSKRANWKIHGKVAQKECFYILN